MNSNLARVEVVWNKRGSLPSGPKYSSVAKVERLSDKWPQEAWSIVLYFSELGYYCQKLTTNIELLFAENAPADLLTQGERFEIYEGRRVVARGVIL